MMIKKHDTNGTKSLLTEGEFGYDKQGLDRGRVYIGTNTGNTALAKKSEVDSKINSSLAGVSNGIATLGSDGKLTSSQMPTSVLGSLVYDGVWDASTNTPIIQLASALNSGHYYKVSISGFTNIDGISEWNVGDWIISNGVSWDKIDNTDSITSVNGMSGAVVLTKNDIGLGNLTNILDSQRCVLSATKLSTARNINGVPFDGTTDINIATVDAYTKTETNACLALKQNSLVSGTNIKTVNGSSILGSGNISVQSTLVSGTNIKTINGQSIVGSGDFVITTDVSTIPFSNLINTPTTISGYGITDAYTKTESDTRASQKQDVLYSGVNIKTVNGQSLIGGGNINIASGVTSVAGRTGDITLTKNDVGLDLVTNISDGSRNVLSATKLTTARNINGVPFDGTNDITINTTDSTKEPIIPSGTIAQYYRGDKTWAAMPTSLPASDVYAWAKAATKPSYTYSEISGTPSIPAAQVQSDWNAVSGMGVILNKPTLFSGSYSDLTDKPTIPTVPINVSAFTNDSGYITNAYHDNTKQDLLVAGTNIKTINGSSILGSGDLVITASGVAWGSVTGTISSQTDLQTCFNAKQNTLVSGTSIKTINGNSLLGSGNIVVSSSESIATAIASAATTSISAAGANSVHITGTTTITSLGTGTTGQTVKVIFDGALILTHNDTSLMNISNANITTAAGDTAVFLNENGASGYWRMLSYTRKDGTALVAPTSVPIAKCLVNTVSTCVNEIIPVMATNSNGLTTCIATSEVNACAIKNLIMCATGSCSKVCMYTCLYSKSNLAQKMLNVTSNPGFNDCTLVSSESGNVYRDYYINATYGQNSRYVSRIVSSYGYVCMLSSVNSTNGVGNIINAFSCSSNSTMYLTTCVGGTTNNTKRAMTCIASLSSTAAATVVCIESCQVSGSGSGVSCIEMKSPTIKLIGLPTTNPGVSGALWNNNGVLNIVP